MNSIFNMLQEILSKLSELLYELREKTTLNIVFDKGTGFSDTLSRKEIKKMLGNRLATDFLNEFKAIIDGEKYPELKGLYPKDSIIKINTQTWIVFPKPFYHFCKFKGLGWFDEDRNRKMLLKDDFRYKSDYFEKVQ